MTSPRELKQLEEKILKEQTSPHGAQGKLKNLAQDPKQKAIPEEAEENEDEQLPGGKKGQKKGPRGAGGTSTDKTRQSQKLDEAPKKDDPTRASKQDPLR